MGHGQLELFVDVAVDVVVCVVGVGMVVVAAVGDVVVGAFVCLVAVASLVDVDYEDVPNVFGRAQ